MAPPVVRAALEIIHEKRMGMYEEAADYLRKYLERTDDIDREVRLFIAASLSGTYDLPKELLLEVNKLIDTALPLEEMK